MDKIYKCSQGAERFWFGDLRIAYLLSAEDVVLLASSNIDLQHALGLFVAEYGAAKMRVSTSKSRR